MVQLLHLKGLVTNTLSCQSGVAVNKHSKCFLSVLVFVEISDRTNITHQNGVYSLEVGGIRKDA